MFDRGECWCRLISRARVVVLFAAVVSVARADVAPPAAARARSDRPKLRLDPHWFTVNDQGAYALSPPRGDYAVPRGAADRAHLSAELARLFAAAIRDDRAAASYRSWSPALALLAQLADGKPIAFGRITKTKNWFDQHGDESAFEDATSSVARVGVIDVTLSCAHACCGWSSDCSLTALFPNGDVLAGNVDQFGAVDVSLTRCPNPPRQDGGGCEDVAPSVHGVVPAPGLRPD